MDDHAQAQQRLYDATARAMFLHYCREPSTWSVWRRLRGLTIDCNYDFRRWKRHQQASRHLGLWKPRNILFADTVRRLLVPDLLVIWATSALVCYYNAFLAVAGGLPLLQLPFECFSVTSVALGLLVTFKTQTCYGRFDDARFQWGMIINESRGFASRILSRIPSPRGGDEQRVLRARLHAAKLIQSFGHTVKYHLTEDGCNPHIQVQADTPQAEIAAWTAAALRVELEQLWDMADEGESAMVEKILAPDAGSRPLIILNELTLINARVFADPLRGGLDPIVTTEFDRSLTVLHHSFGRCERILRTPVYTPYTKFTSRFLYVYCTTLPMAMYPLLGPVVTPPASVVIAFFLLGIQDIGARVEQPFNVLPLWQYCQNVDQSVDQALRQTKAFEDGDGSLDAYLDLDGLEDFGGGHLLSWQDPALPDV